MFRHVSACGWWFGATWPSHGLPRGTFILVVVNQNVLESVGFDPRTSPPHKPSQHPPDRYTAICSLLHMCV
jgi:hypothetical protein